MSRTLAALALLAAAAAVRAAEPGDEAARSYRVSSDGSTTSVEAGKSGRIVVALEAIGKVHVDPRAPLKVVLTATDGLRLGKERLGHKDAADPRAGMPRFEVPFVAAAPGKQEARARLDFFLCSDQWCVKQTRDVVVAVDVR
jgi:hypothetical protein